MSVATDQNVIHARDMCKHALLRSDCRVCVPQFCSHGHTRFECEHCIHAIQLSSPDMSELSTLKREKARQRQIKSRLKNQVLTASPVYVSSVQISEPHLRNICWKCSAKHDSDMQCVCVRCHYLHPDSDCPSKKYRSVANHHYRITSDRCALCGNPHGDDVQCPPVNSFEFYYSDHISLLELPQPDICIMCSAQHDSDMPCLCVRCHTRHPDADCPIALELPDDQQSVLLSGRMHICRICSLRHSHNESCRCVICHSRHPLGDCPRVPVQRCCHTSVNAAVRSLALTVNVDNTEAHSCGSMSIVCPHCRSRSWKHERLNCCNDGQINVPQLNVVPAELSDLILSSHVRSNFRIYNSVMALASVGHSNKSVIGGTFVLGGSAYHRIGSLIPGQHEIHKFAQIYILNTDDATSRRLEIAPSLRPDVLNRLHLLMLEHNHLARTFKTAAASDAVHVTWKGDDDMEAFDVGAIIAQPGFSRDIVVSKVSDNRLHSINANNQYYHALTYPLLFPTGCAGWHPNMVYGQSEHRKISLCEYMRFMLMHRDVPSHVQRCERLTLEYICDAQAQVEARELHFHSLAIQQAKYRSASAQRLVSEINLRHAEDIGVPVILPCSFTGSPKYYHRLYLDAMALPRRFGKPDLFITMTANPSWPEISNAIPGDSNWIHHPDIVARVFLLKLNAMMEMICKKKLFGNVLAHCHRIEWQARGLPHAHILIILEVKVICARQIDALICAEIPNPTTHPRLHAIVKKCMIHKPCDCNAAAGCRLKGKNGSCLRRFPKSLQTQTTASGEGYPKYRRRALHTTVIGDRIVTDDWVVPYNPLLLMLFNCHINIEVSTHRRCFKYVYKYVFKAPDHAFVELNEISSFISGRLLSASEAAWRLLSLKLHQEYPAVCRLDVHLPCHQMMIFDPTADPRDIMEAASRQSSTLIEWFALNRRDPRARQYKYIQIPEHYCFKDNSWYERERGTIAVGRMYGVSTNNAELFALRSMLDCVAGAQSFEDLTSIDGHIYPTFRQACEAYGMIHDDSEWIQSFQEMLDVRILSLQEIREQFALILINLPAVNAMAMFQHFAMDLCGCNPTAESTATTLWAIQHCMKRAGRSLADSNFGFTLPDSNYDIQDDHNAEEECDPYVPAVLSMVLSEEQQFARVKLMELIDSQDRNVITILARAGTGKSAWVHYCAAQLRAQNQTCICVAASALAATGLPRGRTAHAAFNIPVPCFEDTFLIWNVDVDSQIRRAACIFWDEISMVSVQVVDALNRSLKRLMRNDRPFGGKVIVFLGDFRQLPPVDNTGDGTRLSVSQCDWFQSAVKLEFTFNFRAATDSIYASMLEQIGDGEIIDIEVPSTSTMESVDALISRVYSEGITNYDEKRMILAMTLDQCAAINDECINRIPGDCYMAMASDDMRACKNRDLYPQEYIASLNFGGVPPACLKFKLHARFMIIKNYNPPEVCNGVLCELLSWSKFCIQVRLLSGPGERKIVMLPRCNFSILEGKSGLPFSFARWQFPIVCAYAVTIHKSQGQSLHRIGLFIEADAFVHGLIYVALSRVASWSRVYFFSPEHATTIKNKVCKGLLINVMRAGHL